MDEPLAAPAFAAQDFNAIKTSLDGIAASSQKVSKSLTSAFSSAVVSGKSFDQTLLGIGTSLSKIALNAALEPVQKGLSGALSSLFSGLSSGASASAGAAVTPFAEGGIVAQPTFFGSGGSVGLMGERGAEAIVPLARGPNGALGLAAPGGAQPMSVNVTIATQDADSFRRSSQQISTTLARAVARGQRGL